MSLVAAILLQEGISMTQQAAPHPDKVSSIRLRPYQQEFIDRLREVDAIKPINLVKTAIAPICLFDIDDALMRYSIGDVELTQRLELLRMLSEVAASQDGPQSYPISNLPEALRPGLDPFHPRATKATYH
jgi:hypothetical protein